MRKLPFACFLKDVRKNSSKIVEKLWNPFFIKVQKTFVAMMWIVQNFSEQHFYRTHPGDCLWPLLVENLVALAISLSRSFFLYLSLSQSLSFCGKLTSENWFCYWKVIEQKKAFEGLVWRIKDSHRVICQ